MRKYLTLTSVLLKNTMGMLIDGKSKKGFQFFIYIILAVCCLPMLGVFYMLFDSLLEPMAMMNQTSSVLAIGFQAANILTFFFSIFLIPSVFYFSKDSATLLSLPLKPQTILASKFTVCLMYEYIFTFAVTIPMFIAYYQYTDITFINILAGVVALISMPIYPLILSSMITALIMRFVPFFKNRDRFNMIAGVVAIVFALIFSFFVNDNSMQNADPQLILKLLTQENGLLEMFGYLFPAVPFIARAIVSSDVLQLVFYGAIVIAACAIFLIVGKYVYFQGAIGFSETSSNRKQLSESDMQKSAQQRNKIRTYMSKEWKLLIRTPIYLQNCLGTAIIMPIVLLIVFVTTSSDIDMSAISQIDFNGYLPYAIIVGLALGLFFANMNLISSTAISREGSNYVFMKYIPMNIKQQINAKVYIGILVAIASQLLMVIVIYFIFPYLPLSYYIACFLASMITCVMGNYIGILIDLMHPKLVWEQEAAAVKQNMTGMVAIMGGMALCFALGFLIYLLPSLNMTILSIGLIIICVGLTFMFRIITMKKASYFVERM